MSDNEAIESSNGDHAKPADDSVTPETEKKPTTAKPAKSSGGGRGIAWLALLIALGAAGGAGWLWWQDQQGNQGQNDRLASLQADMQRLSAATKATDQKTTAALSSMDNNVQQLAPVSGKVTQLEQQLTRLGSTVDALETKQQQALQRLGAARSQWLEAEVEYLLRIAHQRLVLQGDPLTTRAALEAADERLKAIADPGFLPVRERIRQHLVKLSTANQADITGLALTLSGLSEQAASLPLPDTTPDRFEASEKETPEEPREGWRKLLDEAWAELKSLVRITETDGRYATLPTADDRRVLVQALQLKLETAKLALLQGRMALFQAEAQAARQWISTWFDSSSAAVTGALSELDSVTNADTKIEWPDLATTLRLFSQLRTSNQPPPAAPSPSASASAIQDSLPGQPAIPTQAIE